MSNAATTLTEDEAAEAESVVMTTRKQQRNAHALTSECISKLMLSACTILIPAVLA